MTKTNQNKRVSFLTAVVALALVFGACKKDGDVLSPSGNKSLKSVVLAADGTEFDLDVLYVAHQDGNSGAAWKNIGADPSKVTDGGNIFRLYLTSPDGTQYNSFCAGAHSKGIAGDGGSGKNYTDYKVKGVYKIGDGYDDLIGALNYINTKYGSIDSWSAYYTVETSTRLLSQVLIWNLWNGIPIEEMTVNSSALSKMSYYVQPIMDALANTNATGEIIGFVYLVCSEDIDGELAENCQPQIVPIYGIPEEDPCEVALAAFYNTSEYAEIESRFNALYEGLEDVVDPVFITNLRTKYIQENYPDIADCLFGGYSGAPDCEMYVALLNKIGDSKNPILVWIKNEITKRRLADCLTGAYGSVTATNTTWKNNLPVNAKNGNYLPYDGKNGSVIVPNSNHFTYAKLDRTALANGGVDLVMVVGNKVEQCGTAFVKLSADGKNLEITINNFGKGDFGAIAFGDAFAKGDFPKNGNIHSQKAADSEKAGAVKGVAFNHDNKLTIPCPTGNTIYLYIHCGTIQFFQ